MKQTSSSSSSSSGVPRFDVSTWYFGRRISISISFSTVFNGDFSVCVDEWLLVYVIIHFRCASIFVGFHFNSMFELQFSLGFVFLFIFIFVVHLIRGRSWSHLISRRFRRIHGDAIISIWCGLSNADFQMRRKKKRSNKNQIYEWNSLSKSLSYGRIV